MSNIHDIECMSRALQIAKLGIYTTRPNPNVGCVITNAQGEIVGEGYHQRAGGPHAEINALNQASSQAKGGTAYVTLEPCCHDGKTGPCTQALINAGISKVFSAMRDPNPLVSGKGIEELQQHGIEVEESLLENQSTLLNKGFIKRMKVGLPWVTIKVANSSDGRTALKNGQSKWISSEFSRLDVQKLRARFDAIMTGIGTVLSDDPHLNIRITGTELGINQDPLQPLKIVIDPKLNTPVDSRLLSQAGMSHPNKTIIFANLEVNASAFKDVDNCNIVNFETTNDKFKLHSIFSYIATLEVNSVLIEAGASLLGELLNARLADELIQYVAPTIMGNDARGAFELDAIHSMDECISLEHQDVRQFGNDIRITSLIKYN